MSYSTTVPPLPRTVSRTQLRLNEDATLTVSGDSHLTEVLGRLNLSVCVKHSENNLAQNKTSVNDSYYHLF